MFPRGSSEAHRSGTEHLLCHRSPSGSDENEGRQPAEEEAPSEDSVDGAAADEADDGRSRTSSEVRAQADARFREVVRGLNALAKRLLHDYRCRVRMNSKMATLTWSKDGIYWLNMAGSSTSEMFRPSSLTEASVRECFEGVVRRYEELCAARGVPPYLPTSLPTNGRSSTDVPDIDERIRRRRELAARRQQQCRSNLSADKKAILSHAATFRQRKHRAGLSSAAKEAMRAVHSLQQWKRRSRFDSDRLSREREASKIRMRRFRAKQKAACTTADEGHKGDADAGNMVDWREDLFGKRASRLQIDEEQLTDDTYYASAARRLARSVRRRLKAALRIEFTLAERTGVGFWLVWNPKSQIDVCELYSIDESGNFTHGVRCGSRTVDALKRSLQEALSAHGI